MLLCPLLLGIVLGVDKADVPVAENEQVSIALGRDSLAAVVSLIDKRLKRQLISASATPPLFRLSFSEGDDRQAALKGIHAGEAQQVRRQAWSQGEERGTRITFSGFKGRPFEVVCTIFTRGDDGLVRFGLEASLPPDVTLERVEYPVIAVGPLSPNNSQDIAVVGATKGGIQRLSTWKEGESQWFDQPGSLAAGFACCYDDQGGVYTAAYDSVGHRKVLSLKRTAQGLNVTWTYPCFQRDRFTLPYELVLTGFASPDKDRPTDWRDGADLYKAWATKQAWCARRFAERDDLPAWLKQGPAMVRFTRAWLAQPKMIESWLREYWSKEMGAPSPLITAYWGWEHAGKWVGPQYFPAYPSDETFGHLVQLGRNLGAHTFLWPSGYNYSLSYGKRLDGSFLWDRREELDSIARPHAVVNRDGQPMVRDCIWLRGGQHCTVCPGDPWTIDWLNRAAVDCARHGAEIVQVDQVVGGKSPACYSRSHAHPPGPGRWTTDVFRRQLQTMLQECRKIEPDTVVGFEEPNEWFLQEIGIQDYRDCDLIWRGQEPASVFSYLYHEYMPTLFQSNRSQSGHDPYALAWCLVVGQIPHLAPRWGLGPGPMVVDGGFEHNSDEGPGEFPRTMLYPGQPWCGGETEIDREVRHSGQASLKLHNLNASDTAMASQNYEITEIFRPGRTYRLSVWMRTSQIANPSGMVLEALAPGMKRLQAWEIRYPANQPQWSRGEVVFSMPTDTTLLRVMLMLRGPGAVWLDDLKIEEIRADGTATDVQRPPLPVDHELMRQWIATYHGAGRPYLLCGKMLHPPCLTIATPGSAANGDPPPVLHNAFEASDGSQAVVLVNWTATPQTVCLTWKDRQHTFELKPSEVHLVN